MFASHKTPPPAFTILQHRLPVRGCVLIWLNAVLHSWPKALSHGAACEVFICTIQESSLEGSSSGFAGKGEPNMGLEKVQARLVTSPWTFVDCVRPL